MLSNGSISMSAAEDARHASDSAAAGGRWNKDLNPEYISN